MRSYMLVTGVFLQLQLRQRGEKKQSYKIKFMRCKTVPPLERADYRVQTCVSSALVKACEEKR